MCHGTFDLLHPGHIKHLISAKNYCDLLIVTITADKFINKGPNRPVFNQRLRAESIAALSVVGYVAVVEEPTAIEAISKVKPDFYIKGSEYSHPENDPTGKIHDEIQLVTSFGGEILYTNDIVFSSSKIINSQMNVYSDETEKWLNQYRSLFSSEEVCSWIEKLSNLKVLVVGEAIIDEYVFCDGLGKAAKDPILAFLYHNTETFAGGSLAVANHVAGFCSNVTLISLIGEHDSKEDFIRNSLRSQVTFRPLTQNNSPTIHKRRFVDKHTGNKIFELYLMNDSNLSEHLEGKLIDLLDEQLKLHDVVIVPDYGHGMMSERVVKKLIDSSKFLVVNTQSNAGNRGFNTISKYSKADYVCIAGNELELEMRKKHKNFDEMIRDLSDVINCQKYTITVGKSGTIHYQDGKRVFDAPALTTKIVDRVGAGDSVLAITGMLTAINAPWQIIGLISNLVGAQMVGDLGNKVNIEKGTLSKHVISLLK